MWCAYAFSLLFVLDTKMGRGVEMKCSGGSVKNKTYSSFLRYRPPFMERVPPGVPSPNGGRGVPPPNGGSCDALLASFGKSRTEYARLAGGAGTIRRRSPFPLKDDAGYIGYLTDDEEDTAVVSGSGDGASTVARRRRELLGSDADMSFSNCLFMMITVCGLLMLFLFAVSPWGVPPPRRL